MKKVMVSGCFDLLHSGHIAFFETASKYGELYVCIGSDANIFKFDKLYTLKKEFLNVEDMWLSYICTFYNWKLERTFLVPKNIISDATNNNHQFKNMNVDHKLNFLKYMIKNYNWPHGTK